MIVFFLLLKSKPTSTDSEEIKISVIIAAKNEEKNLSELVSALVNQNYSNENYEVIIVDDNSTDSTFSLGKDLISTIPNFNIIKAEKKEYVGKRGALQIGIENSNYEYLLFTDADCLPSDELVNSYSNKFKSGKEIIFGAAPYRQDDSLLNKIICYDNLWVHILTFSLANIGLPYSAAGRSFGIRKGSFFSINGYQNTLDTLSGDDDLLLREGKKHGLKIGFILSKNSFVYSESKKNLKDFIAQKSRHTTTSHYYSIKVKIVVGTWHLLNLLMLFSPLLTAVSPDFMLLFFAKIILDLITIKSLMSLFGYKFSTIDIIGLTLYHQVLLILFFAVSKFRKSKW